MPSPSIASVLSSSDRARSNRWSGTNRSRTTTVLLPVARIPDVNHTSSTSTSSRGSAANHSSNSGSVWTAFTMTQSAWAMPVAHSHRPDTISPPDTADAVPVGARGAGAIGVGPAANTSSRPSVGNFANSQPWSMRNDSVHADAAHPCANSRVPCDSAARPRPCPPIDVGTTERNRSAAATASIVAAGTRRNSSPTAACSARSGAIAEHRATNSSPVIGVAAAGRRRWSVTSGSPGSARRSCAATARVG